MNVRRLPAQSPIVESGPIRFGDDYAGLFLRGGEYPLLYPALERAVARASRNDALILGGLLDMLEACVESGDATPPEAAA